MTSTEADSRRDPRGPAGDPVPAARPAEPLVSVGIPTYDRPESLRRALAGATAQTYRRLEILVSDNASPGTATAEVVAGFAASDARVSYRRHERNVGAAANFRSVLDRARGDLFIWLADDDEWDAGHLSRLVEAHESGFYHLVTSQSRGLSPTDRPVAFDPLPASLLSDRAFRSVRTFLSLHHHRQAKANLIYGLFRRETLLRFPTLDEATLDVGGDNVLALRVLAEGPCRLVDEVTWTRHYRYEIERSKRWMEVDPARLARYLASRTWRRAPASFRHVDAYTACVSRILRSRFTGWRLSVLRALNEANRWRLVSLL